MKEWETATGVGTANSVKIFQLSGRDLDGGKRENDRSSHYHDLYIKGIDDDDWGPSTRPTFEDSETRSDSGYDDVKLEVCKPS